MKHVKQQTAWDCGVATLAMLADVPYWRAAAASSADDYPHPILPREMAKLLRRITGRSWDVAPGRKLLFSDLALPPGERAAVGITDPDAPHAHWVACESGRVHCPSCDGPGVPDYVGPKTWITWIVRQSSGKEAATMKITPKLKSFLRQEHGLSASASDGKARELVLAKMASGELDAETVAAKSQDEAKSEQILDKIAAKLMQRAEQKLTEQGGSNMDRDNTPDSAVTPQSLLLGKGNKGPHTKDGFSTERMQAKHVKTGEPVFDRGRTVMTASERDTAKAGAFLKWSARRAGLPVALDDLDLHLIEEMQTKDPWCGKIGNEWHGNIDPADLGRKALLNDSTSGGDEVSPIWMDDQLIEFPLTSGELYGFVDVRDVPRGKNIEAATIENPLVVWNQAAEGSALTVFNTANLIGEINTTIFAVTCAIEVGKDFLSDAAADVGKYLVAGIGRRLQHELDRVIAVGNGTDEPTGIFTASGVPTVSAANPTTGPLTVGDYEALMFAIDKAERVGGTMAYLASDTMYGRTRGVAIGSDDARRAFGMDHANYSVLSTRFAVNNSITNGYVGYGNLKRYRMYRRMGFSMEWHTQGQTLGLKNTVLLIVRGRFGGQPVAPTTAFAKMLNGAVA